MCSGGVQSSARQGGRGLAGLGWVEPSEVGGVPLWEGSSLELGRPRVDGA